jgi:CRISPR/Cas system CSM-associated protein Csm4 (group 5 of RAMP superfamily)
MLNKKNWTRSEIALVKELYPSNKVAEIAEKTNRSIMAVRLRAQLMGIQVDKIFLRKKKIYAKVKNNPKVARIIEEYVNNPNLSIKTICELNNISYFSFNKYIGLWFAYKGTNSKILVLQSKV